MQKTLYISGIVLSIVMVCSPMDKQLTLYEQTNSELNFASHNFTLAQEMLNTDPKKALLLLDVLVKNNVPPAQHLLADILKQGCYGVEKDEQKALEYYKVAAENNYKKSQFALGLHYLQLAAVPRPLAIKKRHIKGEPLSYSFYNEKVAQKMLNYLENTDKQVGYNKINYLMGQRSSQEACIIFERAFLDHITKDMFNSDTIDMFLSSGAYQTLTSIITDKKEHDFVKKQAQYVSGSFWYEALRCGLSEDQLNRLNIKYQLVDNNKNKKNLYELYHDKAYTLLKKANNSWAFLCLGEMIHSGYKPEQNQSSAYFFYQAFIHSKTDEKKEGLQKLALQHLKELANKGDIEAENYLQLLAYKKLKVEYIYKESQEEHKFVKTRETGVDLYNKGAYEEAFKYFENASEDRVIADYYLAKICFEQKKSYKKAIFYYGRIFDYVFQNQEQYGLAKDIFNEVLKIIASIAEENTCAIEIRVAAQYYMGISYLNRYVFTKHTPFIKDGCLWLLKAEENFLKSSCKKKPDAEEYLINKAKEILANSQSGELAYTLGKIYLNRSISGKVLNNADLEICKKYILDAEIYGFAKKANIDEKKRMADIYYELGLCAKRVNNNTDTDTYFNRALSFQSNHPHILFERGKIQFDASLKNGKKEQDQEGYSNILFAANNDVGLAQYWLADAFLKGKDDTKGHCKIKQDIGKGIKWLGKATKSKNIEAMILMADFYRKGTDTIKKDIDKAIELIGDIQGIIKKEHAMFSLTVFLLAACYYEKALEVQDDTKKEMLFMEAHILFVNLLKTEKEPIARLYLAKMYLSSHGIENKQQQGLEHLQLFLDKIKVDEDSVRIMHSLDFHGDIHKMHDNGNKQANCLCGLIAYYIGSYGKLGKTDLINKYFTSAAIHFKLVSKEEQEYITLRCYLASIMMFKQVVTIKTHSLDAKNNIFAEGRDAVQYFLDALSTASEKKDACNEKVKIDIKTTVTVLITNLMMISKEFPFLNVIIKELYQKMSKALKDTKVDLVGIEKTMRLLDSF